MWVYHGMATCKLAPAISEESTETDVLEIYMSDTINGSFNKLT